MAQEARKIIQPTRPVSAPVASAPVSRVKLTAKVTEKGGVSVYGLQRFPVTLYREQWEALLAHGDKILAFLEANADKLATKEESKATRDGHTSL